MKGTVITGPTVAIGMVHIKKCIEQRAECACICHKVSKRIVRIPANEYVKVFELDLVDYASLEEEACKELSESSNKYDFLYIWRRTEPLAILETP